MSQSDLSIPVGIFLFSQRQRSGDDPRAVLHRCAASRRACIAAACGSYPATPCSHYFLWPWLHSIDHCSIPLLFSSSNSLKVCLNRNPNTMIASMPASMMINLHGAGIFAFGPGLPPGKGPIIISYISMRTSRVRIGPRASEYALQRAEAIAKRQLVGRSLDPVVVHSLV